MDFGLEHSGETNIEPFYRIKRTVNNGIKVVEINERDCDYHDFVLVYYTASDENLPFLQQLYEKYKLQEKTICFIGCISESSEFTENFSKYHRFFDLHGTMIAEDEFESMVLSCYSCRGGQTHGDPQDWLNLKSSEDLCCLEETGTSVAEAVEKFYKRFKEFFVTHPESGKMKNVIISIITNGSDGTSVRDTDPISKLSEFLELECSLVVNVNTECYEVEPGILRMTLI